MKFPNLVLKKYCNCMIKGRVYSEGVSETGSPIEYEFSDIKCNYQSSCKTILTPQQKLVQITGTCYIPGDIFPELSEISGGEVEINGIVRKINSCSKCKNPDNSINFIKLELL